MKSTLLETGKGYLSGIAHQKQKLQGIRIFYYHGVVETKKDALLERNLHTIKEFREQIAFLRRFHVLSSSEFQHEMHSSKDLTTKKITTPMATSITTDG